MNTFLFVLRSFFVGLLGLTLFTQPGYTNTDTEPEQPWRVARVSVLEGAASAKTATETEWSAAAVNQPLFAGDSFFTGPGTRAEIQLEDEVFLYLDENTLIEIPFLEDHFGRVSVTEGTVTVHAKPIPVQRPPLEVMSSYFLSTITEPAKARFDVQPSGESEIGVISGEVRINRDANLFYSVQRGERMIITTPNPDTYTLLPIAGEDTFDRWVEVRTATHVAAIESKRYVTNRVAGYRDLDRHGTWVDTKDYGHVWRPTVTTSSWAPYREGHWVWREPAGWVWVSYEPWGWVPYHYGRWVHVPRYEWVWVPKTVYVYDRPSVVYVDRRPLWYPSLVSFSYFGSHSAFSFSVGYGTRHYYDGSYVGWYPLGYNDPFCWRWGSYGRHYHRHYGHDYFVNNGTIIVNNFNDHYYENETITNAVTVMPSRDMASGRYDRKAAVASVETSPQRASRMADQSIASIPNPSANRAQSSGEQFQPITRTEASRTVSTRPERFSTPQVTPDAITTTPARVASAERVSQRSPLVSASRATSPKRGDTSPGVRTARSSEPRTPSSERTTSTSRESVGRSAQTTAEPRTPVTTATRERTSVTAPASRSSFSSPTRAGSGPSIQREPSASRSSVGSRQRTISPIRSQAPVRAPQVQSRSAYEPTRQRAVVPTTQQRNARMSAPTQSRAQIQRNATPRSMNEASNAQRMRNFSAPRVDTPSAAQFQRNSTTQRYTVPRNDSSVSRNSRVYSTPRTYDVPRPNSRSTSPSRSSSVYSTPRSYDVPSPGSTRSYSAPRSSQSRQTFSSPSRSTTRQFAQPRSNPSRASELRRSRPSRQSYSAPSRSSSTSRSYSAPSRSSTSQSLRSSSRSPQRIQSSAAQMRRSSPSVHQSAPRSAPSRTTSPARSVSSPRQP